MTSEVSEASSPAPGVFSVWLALKGQMAPTLACNSAGGSIFVPQRCYCFHSLGGFCFSGAGGYSGALCRKCLKLW